MGMNATDTLPFFVYGSLRPGFHNYRLFERFPHEVADATYTGSATMYANGGGFPYLIQGGDTNTIIGNLVTITDERYYPYALRTIDSLEGYHADMPLTSHYLRKRVVVKDADGNDVTAWTYFAAPDLARMLVQDLPVVESGDWSVWKEEFDRLADSNDLLETLVLEALDARYPGGLPDLDDEVVLREVEALVDEIRASLDNSTRQ